MITENVTLWFIGLARDWEYRSVPFTTEADAVAAMEELEPADGDTWVVFSSIYPVTFEPATMDRKARTWVQDQYEQGGPKWGDWSQADYWEFVEEYHMAGRGAFIVANQ